MVMRGDTQMATSKKRTNKPKRAEEEILTQLLALLKN
jgi:hypothetical protein